MEITIYDCETGETIIRPMTEDEIEELVARQQRSTEQYSKLDAQRNALLEKLGLTENELRQLIG